MAQVAVALHRLDARIEKQRFGLQRMHGYEALVRLDTEIGS